MLIEHPSAAAVAYRYVKELVLDDRLPGGSMISEGQIAGQAHAEPDACP